MNQEILPVGINTAALSEWEEYRKEKGKPLSALAKKKVVNRLAKHDIETQQRMVDRAIENDWQGLHDVEPDKPKSQLTKHQSIHEMLTDTSWAD
jgi:hypothetical protein